MKKGDAEWFNLVSENYKFPCKIAFLLMKDSDGSVRLMSTRIKSKAQIENVKYSHISKATFTSVGSAVLSVKEIKKDIDYLRESERLANIWGFVLRNATEEESK